MCADINLYIVFNVFDLPHSIVFLYRTKHHLIVASHLDENAATIAGFGHTRHRAARHRAQCNGTKVRQMWSGAHNVAQIVQIADLGWPQIRRNAFNREYLHCVFRLRYQTGVDE